MTIDTDAVQEHEAPQVTAQHVVNLLTAPHELPVLYLKIDEEDEDAPLELDVWAAAYVSPAAIVAWRHEFVERYGQDPTAQEIADALPDLQSDADSAAQALIGRP